MTKQCAILAGENRVFEYKLLILNWLFFGIYFASPYMVILTLSATNIMKFNNLIEVFNKFHGGCYENIQIHN